MKGALKVQETKPEIINQQPMVYRFQCDLCDTGYVGYTCGHLHACVDGHKQKSPLIYKHYQENHGGIPKDLLRRFSVLKNVEINLIVWSTKCFLPGIWNQPSMCKAIQLGQKYFYNSPCTFLYKFTVTPLYLLTELIILSFYYLDNGIVKTHQNVDLFH